MDRNYCPCTCLPKAFQKAERTGWRHMFFYPGGGTYKGYWLKNQPEHYGVKTNKRGLIYDGQWVQGLRHGYGTMRQRRENGTAERMYIGEWREDMKCGEGKQFLSDGIYYGFWRKNRRDGIGIMWYKDGSLYMGEWAADVYHGLGVHFYVNGNRYEGHFARGMKNGEGTFYHMHTGQIQKGMWSDDSCKTSVMVDEFRNQGDRPTEYPIPPSRLANPDNMMREFFQEHMANAYKPVKSYNENMCLNFVRRMRRFAKLQPETGALTNVPIPNVDIKCGCSKR